VKNSINCNTRNNGKYRNEQWLRKQYCDKGFSGLKIAKKCGVQKKTVYYWLKKYEIIIRNSGESRLGRKNKRRKKNRLKRITKEVLMQEYVNDGDSMKVIAERYGCSESHIRTKLIKHDIEIREQYGRNGLINGESDEWYRRKSHEVYEEFWREPVRNGYLLHHIDRNPRNFEITNLALVTYSFHSKTHGVGKKKKQETQQPEVPLYTQELIQLAA